MSKTYRGSPNRESWAVHTAISYDEHQHLHWNNRANVIFEQQKCGDVVDQSVMAQGMLANELEEHFKYPHNISSGKSVLARDVTVEQLETVDWDHVADDVLSRAKCGKEYTGD